MTDSGAESRMKAGGGWMSAAAIFITIFIDLVGFSIVFPLLPAMLQWYLPREGSDSLVGRMEAWLAAMTPASGGGKILTLVLFGGAIGSLFSVLQFISSPIWGRLSDRFGRRSVLLITTSFTCFAYVIWVFSGSFWIYVLSRSLSGLMAGNLSVATAAMADSTSTSRRTGGMAILGVAFALGFMIGPAIGGLASLIDLTAYWPGGARFGLNPFSGAALISVTLALINFFWVAFFFPETLRDENRKTHLISFNPFSNLHVDNPSVVRVICVDFTFLMVFSGMEFTLTFLALERLNFGASQNIWIFIFVGVVMTVVQGLFTQRKGFIQKHGHPRLIRTGIVLGLVGMVTLAMAGSWPIFFLGLFFKACGVALQAPAITGLVSLYAPANMQGAVLGAFRAMGSLARAIGPVIAAVLYWAMGSRLTYLLASCVLVVPLYLTWRLPAPPQESK